MDSQSTVMRFSLADIPEADRTSTLREFFGRGVVNCDFIPLTDAPIIEFETRLYPGVAVTYGWHTPIRSETVQDASRATDDLILVWGSRGGRVEQRGLETQSADGAGLLSAAEKVRSETWSAVRNITVRLRRSMLLPLAPRAEQMLNRLIPNDNAALRLLILYLDMIRERDLDEAPELAHAIAAHICDLVALAIGAGQDGLEMAWGRGVKAARLAAVKRWALERLNDPELSVAQAAAIQHVSPRYIQVLFETEGRTFSSFVLSERLALAHRWLADPIHAPKSIGSIAYACGFGDLSYFNRAFRAAFGETPSAVRGRA